MGSDDESACERKLDSMRNYLLCANGVTALLVRLLYGTGMRLMEGILLNPKCT
jgi:hypothetical protein